MSLSVLFWHKSLLYSFFILLSARTICIPFLLNSSKTVVASVVFRRGLRLWFPTAVALAIVKILSSTIGTTYIDDFKAHTGNISFETPYTIPSTLAYFNSVFNLFWTTHKFSEQAGNTAFPSQTLWIVNVIYAQSYTVYMTMVVIPYTRHSWRVHAYMCFIVMHGGYSLGLGTPYRTSACRPSCKYAISRKGEARNQNLENVGAMSDMDTVFDTHDRWTGDAISFDCLEAAAGKQRACSSYRIVLLWGIEYASQFKGAPG